MLYRSMDEFRQAFQEIAVYDFQGTQRVLDVNRFRDTLLDALVYNAVFNPDVEIKSNARFAIRTAAERLGVFPASIQELYEAKGRGKHLQFTVPAINLRGLTYDTARTVFQAAMENRVGPFIFEIARSEVGYSAQWPSEYAVVTAAAAIREGYRGPLFLQGDHFQIKAKIFRQDPELEIEGIKVLIRDSVDSGFFNIDIDTSTLVDLGNQVLSEQQRLNFELSAMFTSFIRGLEPGAVTVSVGGEIGEVGGRNSTSEDLRAFMEGYAASLKKIDPYRKGISKISVQTGTTHGGVPMPDGSIAKVNLDFATLQILSAEARAGYGMAGAVQHGASTLPEELFHRFPETGTAEIHLATGFQNIILDHPALPEDLRAEMLEFLRDKLAGERREGQTDEQFIYKTRKKVFGPFKRRLWDLPPETRAGIQGELKEKFTLIFRKLNVCNTRGVVEECVPQAGFPTTLARETEMVR